MVGKRKVVAPKSKSLSISALKTSARSPSVEKSTKKPNVMSEVSATNSASLKRPEAKQASAKHASANQASVSTVTSPSKKMNMSTSSRRSILKPSTSTTASVSMTMPTGRKPSPGKVAFASEMEFSSLGIHANTLKALHDTSLFGFKTMSKPQSDYMPTLLKSEEPNVFVKASTGSGKTLGFLITAIEMMTRLKTIPPNKVHTLVISPVRDLTKQMCVEGSKLVKYHANISVGEVTGGSNEHAHVSMLTKNAPNILFATPARLISLLNNPDVVKAFTDLKLLVLDEADALLGPGFKRDMEKIISKLPSHRSLFFSATVPDDVKQTASNDKFLGQKYMFVDTVGEHVDQLQIEQFYREADPTCLHDAMHEEMMARMKKPGYKILFFFPTVYLVDFYTFMFKRRFDIDVLKLHGKMNQGARNTNVSKFRSGVNVVMFATDAAGRGMDFPGVTCVMQMGVVDMTQYKQRIGRTGRGGKTGESVIILGNDEHKVALRILDNYPKQVHESVLKQGTCKPIDGSVSDKEKQRLYLSTLGAYKSKVGELGWNTKELVENIEKRFGVKIDHKDPRIQKMFKKMGIKL